MVADLVAMFLARYLPPAGVANLPSRVPVTLVPPALHLTAEQEFYAGGYLKGSGMVGGDPSQCQVELSYAIGSLKGTVTER